MVYALRAADQLMNKLKFQTSKKWAAAGHSQGGNAVLGAMFYSDLLAEYKLVGGVALAPASNFQILSDVTFGIIDDVVRGGDTKTAILLSRQLNYYSTLIVSSIKTRFPELVVADFFGPAMVKLYAKAANEKPCYTLAPAIQKDIEAFVKTGKSVLEYGGLKRDWKSNPLARRFILENEPARYPLKSSLLILQGTYDLTVPSIVTDALVNQYVSASQVVEYQKFEGATHISILKAGQADTLRYLKTSFAK